MLHFEELRYSRDNKTLIIEASIDSLDYYDKVYIDSIVIDTLNTYVNNGPSSNPIYTYKVSELYKKVYSLPQGNCNSIKTEDDSYCFITDTNHKKNVRLEIPINTLGIDPSLDMLFIYVIASGTPTLDTPCGFDNSIIVGTVIDLKKIYTNTLLSLREIEYTCNIPQNFIDFILKYKALELCIRTGNYLQAIKYWKLFFLNINLNVTNKCSCYGNN